MFIVNMGIIYKTTKKEHKRWLKDFIANDDYIKMHGKFIGVIKEDVTNLTIADAQEALNNFY